MKLKKLMIMIIILIVILTTSLIILLNIQKQGEKNNEEILINGTDIRDTLNPELNENPQYEKIEVVKNRNRFYTVVNCIDQFLQVVYEKDNQKIYDLISKEYTNENKITIDNVLQKIPTYKNMQIFSPQIMYEINNTEDISTYYAEGYIKEVTKTEGTDGILIETGEKEKFYIAIQLDKVKRTFAVLPNERVPERNNISKKVYKNIEENVTNVYESANITDFAMANAYLKDYITKVQENLQEAYNKLQQEYREKRFPTQQEFEIYVKNYQEILANTRITDVIVNKDGESVIYYCKDQYGNIYIFKENAILDYTIQLDDYTLHNNEFDETYKSASNMNKGILNCEKFFKMLNMQDYASAYNVLDNNFKQTYFKTQQEFETYIKTKLFKNNKAEYKEYDSKIKDIHAYKVLISDATGASQEQREFNIVMKLLEGTDFVMSFEVN